MKIELTDCTLLTGKFKMESWILAGSSWSKTDLTDACLSRLGPKTCATVWLSTAAFPHKVGLLIKIIVTDKWTSNLFKILFSVIYYSLDKKKIKKKKILNCKYKKVYIIVKCKIRVATFCCQGNLWISLKSFIFNRSWNFTVISKYDYSKLQTINESGAKLS